MRTASLALLAGAIGVIGAVYTARTFALNRAGQITDRFTKAIEQLGHKELDVRLGGIYALERIARDSEDDYPQVVEVLTAYVREHVPRQDEAPLEPGAPDPPELPVMTYTSPSTPVPRPTTDIQAVLTVLGRRTLAHDEEDTRLDLSSAVLKGANLSGANLAGADLSQADLRWARLGGDLSEAKLDRADLTEASLASANLRQAQLDQADLTKADLSGADLSAARLSWASLRGAKLIGTKLTGADLTGANLAWTDPGAADFRNAKYNMLQPRGQRTSITNAFGLWNATARSSATNRAGAGLLGNRDATEPRFRMTYVVEQRPHLLVAAVAQRGRHPGDLAPVQTRTCSAVNASKQATRSLAACRRHLLEQRQGLRPARILLLLTRQQRPDRRRVSPSGPSPPAARATRPQPASQTAARDGHAAPPPASCRTSPVRVTPRSQQRGARPAAQNVRCVEADAQALHRRPFRQPSVSCGQ